MTIALHCTTCGTLSEVTSAPPVKTASAKRFCPSCGSEANVLESTNVFVISADMRDTARRNRDEHTG